MRTLPKLCYPSKAVQYENVGLGTEDILCRLLVLCGSGQRLIKRKKESHICFRVIPLLTAPPWSPACVQ